MAFGENKDSEWIKTIKPLLIGFGAFFSAMLTFSLVLNLWYQVGSGKALERLLKNEGSKIPMGKNNIRRTLSPKDFDVSIGAFIKRLFTGLIGSTLLLIVCVGVTISLFWLLGKTL